MEVIVKLSDEFGNVLVTRFLGKKLRFQLAELMKQSEINSVIVDFSGVESIASSFADEAFAKLQAELHPVDLMKKLKTINDSKGTFNLTRLALQGHTRPVM